MMEGVKPAALIGLNWRQSFYFPCSFRDFQIEVKKHQSTLPLISKPSNLFETRRQLVGVMLTHLRYHLNTNTNSIKYLDQTHYLAIALLQ